MLSRKYRITTTLTVLAVLAFSTFATSLVYAAPLANDGKDWQYVNGNSWAQNYSPQTQINKNNVQDLEVKWLFPLGGKDLAPTALRSLSISEGASAPPIVRDGLVYSLTNYKRIYAIDAKTGAQRWVYQYTVDVEAAKKRLPLGITAAPHSHGFRYWEGGDAILDYGLACDIYAVDAKTGKEKFKIPDLCLNVPGNTGLYSQMSLVNAATVGTYEKGREFIVILPSQAHRRIFVPDTRHVTMGISMDAPYNVNWRVFSSPPQDKLSKDWAFEECDIGYFNTFPCSDVAAKNRAGLEWDSTLPGQLPISAGATSNWGQLVVDEDTGILYTQTGNQAPYGNMSLVPGPRLYGSTIMAIDMTKGKRVWWVQPFPHDPYDYDCNWSGILTEHPTLGKVYMKGCKEGVLYVLDAETGKPIYTVDAQDELIARGQMGALPNGNAYKYYRPDPYSFHDMREWNWVSYPAKQPGEKGEHFTLPFQLFPTWLNGLFATDMSFDPQTQTLYHYAVATATVVLREGPSVPNADSIIVTRSAQANVSIVARDLATGKVKWTWFYPHSYLRPHMVVSGDMVFTSFPDGYTRFFDKDSGKLLRELNVGGPVEIGLAIGKDSAGDSKIFLIGGSTNRAGPEYGVAGLDRVPGTLIALGLSDRAAAEVKTTTITSTQSTTSTITTTSATTVTTAGPAQTVTATKEVTQTAETIGPITYAAIGIAVIAIAAAVVLMMRKK